MVAMKFGECLRLLLSILDISMNRLSKAINVDNSLVNRWIHGKRIPMYDTPYIEDIAEYLSKNVFNSFQIQRLNELSLGIYETSDTRNTIKEKMMRALLEAQGYSMECKKKEQRVHKDLQSREAQSIENMDEQSRAFITGQHPPNSTPFMSFSAEDKVVRGRSNVFLAMQQLLETTANQPCSSKEIIYISLNNDIEMMDFEELNLIYLRDLLSKAIENGWEVLCIIRLDSNIKRIVKFMRFVKPLIKTGKFKPYYLEKYDIFSMGKEILCVPGTGALSCYSTKPHLGVDCAFYLKTEIAVEIIKDYFDMLLTAFAKPLVNYYEETGYTEYAYLLAESEEGIDNRILYKYGFSVLTLPKGLYNRLLDRLQLPPHEAAIALEIYERRLSAFLRNLRNYTYKDIYILESVKQLIGSRRFNFYFHMGAQLMELQLEDVIEILQNIVFLLNKYDNYSVAFRSNQTSKMTMDDEFFCVVKERQAVLLEAYEPSGDMPVTRLSVEEPTVVQAFVEYLDETLSHIAPVNKDKQQVVDWLEGQIRILRRAKYH